MKKSIKRLITAAAAITIALISAPSTRDSGVIWAEELPALESPATPALPPLPATPDTLDIPDTLPAPLPEEPAVDPEKPMIALTFDDGPNASVTARILDSLEANGAKATFFIVGNRVTSNANKNVVARMAKLGCEIGNHTYEHKSITKLGAKGIKSQLTKTNKIVESLGGTTPILMRPPGGAKTKESMKVVGSIGMSAVLWNVDTLDWKTKNKQKTIDAVLGKVKDGDIILMHDLYSTTADAAEFIIPELVKQGYQLVTVSELAKNRGGIKAGQTYGSFRR